MATFFGDQHVEMMLRFLETFGGMTVQVPPVDTLMRAKRDVEIWEAVHRCPNRRTVLKLSRGFEMSEDSVCRAYRRVCGQLGVEDQYGTSPTGEIAEASCSDGRDEHDPDPDDSLD